MIVSTTLASIAPCTAGSARIAWPPATNTSVFTTCRRVHNDVLDSTKHTATQGKDGQKADDAQFDLQLDPGASDSFTFDTAGTYDVTCTIHSQMNMTITVQ